MATQKFSDLTAVTTPNTESVFAVAYSGANYKLTITDLAANLPAVTATSLTSSGTLTTSSNATIGGDLTISGDDLFMATNTSGAALIADGTNFNPVVISGDISIGTTGTAAIGSGVIIDADVNASAALAFSKMENLTVSRLLVSDGSGDVSVSAVTSTEAGYLDGVSSAIQTQLDSKASSSYVPTTITVADESTDTTCFPLFTTAATGDLGPKTASGLTFNANTDVLSGTFAGNITGNVTGNASGSAGSCTGNSATATTSTNVTVADESSDTTCFPLFTTAATGDLAPKSGSNLAFNSSSGILTATGFAGDITGDVTGNTSGSSGSCTGNSATATSAATLTTARNIGGVSFNGSANIDLPGVNASGSQNTSGTSAGLSATLIVGSGGTGATSLTANGVLIGNGTSAVTAVDMSTKGKILIGDGSGNPQTLSVGSNDQILTADSAEATGVKWAAAAIGGLEWQSSIVTGTTLTAVAGRGYWINTTSNICTITLPGSASVGDQLVFTDYARTWGSNKIVIDSNGLKYQGDADTSTVEYSTAGQSIDIVYSGATQGWIPNTDEASADAPVLPFTATGGTTSTYGAYTVHTFTSSGTFTPSKSGTVEALVIGGGGGSTDSTSHGGAGAGGIAHSTDFSVSAQDYTITVGAGGAMSNTPGAGANSSIDSFPVGLGGGKSNLSQTASERDGGSGGGGGQASPAIAGGAATQTGQGTGSSTTNYGYAGGGNYYGNEYPGGGGGGAGGAGATGASSGPQPHAGVGGLGRDFGTFGGTGLGDGGYFASGGSAGQYDGTGPDAPQGGGGDRNNGANGAANTGGGGGTGGAGGSGVVIIRYLT